MEIVFAPPLADATEFPSAEIKATPPFKLSSSLSLKKHTKVDDLIVTKNGRGALGIAAKQLMHAGQKNVVLLPAYHCPALVEPFVWLGYEVRFYPIEPGLSVDPMQLSSMLTDDVTHCVFVKFFGLSSNMESLIDLAHQRDKCIIEDYAHALPSFMTATQSADSRIAARICSINKILPTIDGGLLYMPDQTGIHVNFCNWTEELKGVAYLLNLTHMLSKLRPSSATTEVTPVDEQPKTEKKSSAFRYFQPTDLQSASYRHTITILAHTDLRRVNERRRQNYLYLLDKLSKVSAGKVLFDTVAEDVPYVFPFLLNNPAHFTRIRQQKIQVLRWEELADSDCQVSKAYRTRLIQLPCHHELTQTEMDKIVSTISKLED